MNSKIESTCHPDVAKETFGVDCEPRTDSVYPIVPRLTIRQVVILISSILIMIVVLQIPTFLYYNNKPPSEPTIPSFGIDFETCSVSSLNSYIAISIEYSINWSSQDPLWLYCYRQASYTCHDEPIIYSDYTIYSCMATHPWQKVQESSVFPI